MVVQDMPHGTLPLLYTFHFYLFGIIAIVSALLFVTRKSPVAAALWLVNTMFSLAALYVMLDAQFIGVIQVLVYAGAIMVVFLFVIMLLNLGQGVVGDARGLGWKLVAGAVGVALLAQIFALTRSRTRPPRRRGPQPASPSPLCFPRTTAPTIAARSRTLVTSNASKYSLNSGPAMGVIAPVRSTCCAV